MPPITGAIVHSGPRPLTSSAAAYAGSHSVSWNLQSTSGQKVPAGIYFVRFSTRTESETRKVVAVE